MSNTARKGRPFRIAGSLLIAGVFIGSVLVTAARAQPAGGALSKPSYGGQASYWLADAPDCLDPQKTAEASSFYVFNEITDPLLSIDNKGHFVGNIARSFKVTKGGTVITFALKHGIRFSNGDPLYANAVKYTFDRALNPATKSPATAGNLRQIQSTRVVNKYTVQLTLKTAFRPILTYLASTYEGILDPTATQKQGGGSCQKPIGTGPYKVGSVGAAFSTVTLVPNTYHNYGPAWIHNHGKPYISSLVYKVLTSDSTAISEFLTGAISIVPGVPGTQLSRVQGNKKIALHNLKAQNQTFLSFNFAHAPFDNLQVRKAVASVIDRKALVNSALNGQGFPATSAIVPAIPFYDKKAGKFLPKTSISEASRLVSANHATGPYDLLVPQGTAAQAEAELIQAELASAGMKVNLVVKPLSDYIPAAAKGQFDMNLLAWGYNDPDILYLLFHSSQGKGAGLNFTNYSNPTLDSLLVQGRETLNTKKAAKIYAQVQELINKELVEVPLVSTKAILGLRSNIKGYHVSAAGEVPLQDLYISGK